MSDKHRLRSYEETMPAIAARCGLEPPRSEADVDAYIPYLEQMRSDGASVLLKLDGPRPGKNHYTAAASGGPLEGPIRTDAPTWAQALAYIVVEYARACWGPSCDHVPAQGTRPGGAPDTDLLYALQGLGLARGVPPPDNLDCLAPLLPYLEELLADRSLVLLEFMPADPSSPSSAFVASISRGLLGGEAHITCGGHTPVIATARALIDYARRCWGFRW